ncbi:MAG TPA: ABC transporter permease, partial [Acidimicrobiia bacterium]|nr:ABC transporter permease [Acidimicrobiia bacterium]
AILFIAACAALILPEVIDDDGAAEYDVALVAPTDAESSFRSTLDGVLEQLDASARFRTVASVDDARRLVDDGDADVGVAAGPEPVIVVRADQHAKLLGAVRQALASSALADNLANAGLSDAQVVQVLRVQAPRVQEVDTEAAGRRASAAILSIVLYLVLLMLMVQVANGVAIEKANRVSEVLLPIVRPDSLLFGKVIGTGIVGLITLLAGAIPVAVKAVAGGDLPSGLGVAVAGGAPWFVLGLVLYLTIAGSLGALVERQEEAGATVTPLTIILVATFIVAQSAPDSGLAAVLAYIPFTSPLVMPSRIAVGASSPLEMTLSLLILFTTVVVVVRLGAVVYQRAVVRTGRRLKITEILRAA